MAKIYRVIRIKLNQLVAENVDMITDLPTKRSRGVVGRGRLGGQRPPFFRQGDVSPLPLFWTEIRAKVSPQLQLVTY